MTDGRPSINCGGILSPAAGPSRRAPLNESPRPHLISRRPQ
jgi:hypothetical protein